MEQAVLVGVGLWRDVGVKEGGSGTVVGVVGVVGVPVAGSGVLVAVLVRVLVSEGVAEGVAEGVGVVVGEPMQEL
jgi:hypothetical protein